MDRVDRPLPATGRATTRLRFPSEASTEAGAPDKGYLRRAGPLTRHSYLANRGRSTQPTQAFVPRGPGRIPAVGRPPGSRPSRPGQSGSRSPPIADGAGGPLAAVRAVVEYLDEQDSAGKSGILNEVYPQHQAEFDKPENWWVNFVIQRLQGLRDDYDVVHDTGAGRFTEWEVGPRQ